MKDPFPGARRYLETEQAERREKYNMSKYNKDARQAAAWAIDFLTLFCKRQEDRELIKVITEERIDKLISALLTRREYKFWEEINKDKETEPMISTEYQIAALLMEKGAMKCLERVGKTSTKHGPEYDPVHDFVRNQLLSVLAVLKYATTESRSISHDLKFNPKRYEP